MPKSEKNQSTEHFYGYMPRTELSERLVNLPTAVEVELEISIHFQHHCPAFARLKLKLLGCHTFYVAGELAGIGISCLNNNRR